MIESFISEIKSFDMTSTLGLLMYWLPLALCIVGYSFKTWKEYQSEILDREKTDYYLPTLKIGTIVGRVILSFVPFANCFAIAFDVFPSFLKMIDKFLDIPLVPKLKREEKS